MSSSPTNRPGQLFAWAMRHKSEATEQVASLLHQAAEQFRERGDLAQCALCLVEEAIHWNARLGYPARAEQISKDLAELAGSFADRTDRAYWKAQSLILLARVESRRGRFRNVLRHTARALRIFERIHEPSAHVSAQKVVQGRVESLLNRGYAYYHLGGRMTEAQACAEEAERISPAHRHDALLLRSATLYANDPTAALGVIQQIFDLPTNPAEQGNPVGQGMAHVLMVRSEASLFLGRYQEAINDGLESLRLEREPGRRPTLHTALGRVYLYVNDSRRAIAELLEAHQAFKERKLFGTAFLECGSLLAMAYLSGRYLQAAIAVTEEVRCLVGADVEYAEGWANLEIHAVAIYLEAARTDPPQADFYINQARVALERAARSCQSYRVGLAYVRHFQGVLAERTGDGAGALRSFHQARRLCSRHGLIFLRWQCLQAIARLQTDDRQALPYLRAAAADIRLLRDNLLSPLLTPLFFDDKTKIFESLVQCLSLVGPRGKRSWTYEAVEHIEACKARNIVTSLAASSQWPSVRARIRARLPAVTASETSLLNAYRSLSLSASGAKPAIFQAPDDTLRAGHPPCSQHNGHSQHNRPSQHQALVTAAQQAEHDYLHTLLRTHDLGQHLVHPVDGRPEELLPQLLDPQTAALEYFIAGCKLFCFLCTQDKGIVQALVRDIDPVALHAYIKRCLPDPRHQRTTVRLDASRNLYTLLCQGLDELVAGYRRLIIIPHGALRQIPFGLLHDGDRFLLEKLDGLVHVPSLTVLGLCRRQPRPDGGASQIICCPPDGPPWSRLEGEAVYQRFPRLPQRRNRPRLLMGQDATVERLSSALSAPAIHISTHGAFDSSEPLSSALLFADEAGAPVWLRAHEFFGFQWKTGLVTCAACESGKSFVPRGDSIVGLRYGFFSAGAPSVIDAQWTVDDLASALLMDAFYQAWCAGKDKAEALRLAQQQMLLSLTGEDVASRIEEWLRPHPELQGQHWVAARRSAPWYGNPNIKPFADPAYWAAFTLQGDWL